MDSKIQTRRANRNAVPLACFLWLIVIAGVGLTLRGLWRFPVVASAHGPEMDSLFGFILAITGVAFIVAQLLLGYFIVRYRDRGNSAALHHGQRFEEWTWVLIPAVALLVCDAMIEHRSAQLWDRMHDTPPRDALTIEVTAEQFNWTIRYPGRDGKFGRTDAKLITDENHVGIDPKDPAGQDDIQTDSRMHLPVNRPVRVLLRSKDVLHAFWVPHFRLKQDCVPGFEIPIWFTPTRTGEFEIACAELCGMGHFKMRGALTVESPQAYEAWLKEQRTFGEQ